MTDKKGNISLYVPIRIVCLLTKGLLMGVRIDLNELITKFEKFLIRILREDIELKINCTDSNQQGGLMVMADSGQIEQVLMNLATNARDAMPDGGRLTIETGTINLNEEFVEVHGYGKPGDYAFITVLDTGTGMDDITKQKIFEPFFTTKGGGKGDRTRAFDDLRHCETA